jgi:hypothetical protein
MPTISGVQPDEPFHLAYDETRMILIHSFPSTILANVVDIQPLATKPVLGVSHNTWCRIRERSFDDWEFKYSRVSTSLGIGRLQFESSRILARAIRLDSSDEGDVEKLRRLSRSVGLTDFLSLPVDNIPIYGTFRTNERSIAFTEKNLKKMLFSSIERGHGLAPGIRTSMEPLDVLRDPRSLVAELSRDDLIRGKDKLEITKIGKQYVKKEVVGKPQEAALLKSADLSLLDALKTQFRILESRLEGTISRSKREVLQAIQEVKLQVNEIRDERAVARYVIETPPFSPVKLQLEIPIAEMSEEDVLLKIAEIKARTINLPRNLIIDLRNTLKSLTKVPGGIREKLSSAI